MANATLYEAIPILDVRDVEKALRFYVERLGFQVEFRYEKDPGNYAGVYRDDVHLPMQWQHPGEFERGTAGRLRFRIRVDNPDSLFEEFRVKGVLNEGTTVTDTAWGTREFGFRDPDGNGLIFYRDIQPVG